MVEIDAALAQCRFAGRSSIVRSAERHDLLGIPCSARVPASNIGVVRLSLPRAARSARGGSHGQPLESMPLERLEAEITELAGHHRRCRVSVAAVPRGVRPPRGLARLGVPQLRVLAELEVRARPAHGTGDRLRVAHALTLFPRIREEFTSGRLSYSKVACPHAHRGPRQRRRPRRASRSMAPQRTSNRSPAATGVSNVPRNARVTETDPAAWREVAVHPRMTTCRE